MFFYLLVVGPKPWELPGYNLKPAIVHGRQEDTQEKRTLLYIARW